MSGNIKQTLEYKYVEDLEKNQDMDDRFIVFELNNELLSLELKYIKEVIEIEYIRGIPRLSPKFEGIYNLRGEIIPVLNFNYCIFNKSVDDDRDTGRETKIIIVLSYLNKNFGITVDYVNDILEFNQTNYKNIPSSVESSVPLNFIDKIAIYDENVIKIINLTNFMNEDLSSETVNITKDDSSYIRSNLDMLTQEKRDALKELSNIATGKAIKALSNIIKTNASIAIDIEDVEIKNIIDLNRNSTFDPSEKIVGIRSIIRNDINGSIYLVFPSDELNILLQEVDIAIDLPEEINDVKGLNKTSQSAIQEIGNILISHYCSGISDFLKINIYHDVPEVAIGEFFALIDLEIAKLARYSDQCIILKTKITVKDKPISFDLLFIPYFDSIEKFINWLDVDYIFNLLDSESKTQTLKISSPPPPKLLKKKTAKKTASKKITKKKKKVPIKKKSVKNLKPNTDESIKSEKDIFSKVQSQNTYQLKTADRINLQMSEADLSTFQELGNIAAGNAGNALSQMLNKKVFLEIPPAKVLDIPDLIETFGTSNQKMIGYIGTTKGFFESNIFLMFSTSDIENMLRGILDPDMKKKLYNKTDLTQNEQSAIMEISNILMGHYISALSDFLKSPIDPPEYQFFFLEPRKLLTKFNQSTNAKELKAIIVETLINVDQENQIKGQFILILSQIMVKRILDKISEIW